MGKKKVKIIRLNSNGHTAVEVAQATALELVGQCLDEGQFAFCEPAKIVVSQRSELRKLQAHLEEVIIFAPVAGG